MKTKMILAALATVIAMTGVAHAGWMDEVKARLSITNTTRQIQEYLPCEEKPRPELEVKDNGMLGYHNYHEVWFEGVSEVTGQPGRYKLREPSIWNRGGTSVLYNPSTKHLLVLLDGRTGVFNYRAYLLKAEPMQQLLDAMSAHWEDYKSYLEKPTPEGEKKILAYADVQAALESVKDLAKRKMKKPTTTSLSSIDQKAAIAKAQEHFDARNRGERSELDAAYELADPRKTDEREAAFRKFVYGEGKSLTRRGENMFDLKATAEEEATGAATKVRLYYVGAWLHAVSNGYQPKVFKTVKLKLQLPKTTFITKREIPEIFAIAEKTATLPAEEQAYVDLDYLFTGTVHLDGKKMVATDPATGRVFPMKVTDQLKGMVAIGELEEGGTIRFKVKDDEAVFVPTLKQPLRLSGKVMETKSEKSIIRIRLDGGEREADFYVFDRKMRSNLPTRGYVNFTARNMEILRIEQQR